MLNKFKKIIHNKYSRFSEFIFLRYLLLIFSISIALFITIPIFFNYEQKTEVIKTHLLENYNFELNNFEKIKYKIFPFPGLELSKVEINFKSVDGKFNVNKVRIYSNFLSIYNFEKFNSNKIIFKDGEFKIQISNFKFLIKQLFNEKKNFSFDNLNLKMFDKKVSVVTLNNIKLSNFGYNKNLIRGKVFDKNFKVKIDDNYRNINFKLINVGIKADINFIENKKNKSKFGTFKSKILNTNIKSEFEYDENAIKIFNSYFRNKNISFRNKSEIILTPFLDTTSVFIIEEFNTQMFKKIDLIKFFEFKNILRKVNNKSEIIFKPKKFNRKFFDDLNLKIDLAYGRMNYSSKLLISNGIFKCGGSVNFLEEFPLLFFDCYLKSVSKKEFLKTFSVRSKNKNEIFNLNFKGNFNILSSKVNFKKISMNDNYEASKEDLKYFKNTFESIFFDMSFLNIFDFKKIKEFIVEIS